MLLHHIKSAKVKRETAFYVYLRARVAFTAPVFPTNKLSARGV